MLVKHRQEPIAIEHAPSTEIPTRFRRELVLRTLQSRQNIQRGWGITPSTLDLIGNLLPNKERALRFLRQQKVKGAQKFADSPRRLLYAIAQTPALLHEESQLQRLAQSVFAAVYCDAMGAEGVYNSRLSEPPPPDTETIALPRPLEVAAFHRRELKIAPGIGEALVEARNSPAVGNFLLAPALERPMVETALDHYADVFARVYAAKRPKPEPILGNAGILLHETHGYLVAAFFFLGMVTIGPSKEVVELGKFGLDTVITGATFAHVADRVNLWRQRRVNSALRSELRIAMDHRCHKVPLLLRKS